MRVRTMIALAALCSAPSGALADQPIVARSLAATCANCHGTDGRSASPQVASLAGLPKELIAQRMKEFREGSRPGTIMQQLAKGYTDQQIDMLAAHFAAQRTAK